jgi:hypothetical protein
MRLGRRGRDVGVDAKAAEKEGLGRRLACGAEKKKKKKKKKKNSHFDSFESTSAVAAASASVVVSNFSKAFSLTI